MEMEQRNMESAQSQLADWSGLHHWRTLQDRLGKVIDLGGTGTLKGKRNVKDLPK